MSARAPRSRNSAAIVRRSPASVPVLARLDPGCATLLALGTAGSPAEEAAAVCYAAAPPEVALGKALAEADAQGHLGEVHRDGSRDVEGGLHGCLDTGRCQFLPVGKRQGGSRMGQRDGDDGHDLNHNTLRLRDLASGGVGGGDLHGVAAGRREAHAAQIQPERGTLGGRGGAHRGQELVRRRG